MSHEGKLRYNLGETDSLCGWSEKGGVISGGLLENWLCVFSLLVVNRSPELGHTMCAQDPGPLEAAPVSWWWWDKMVGAGWSGLRAGGTAACGVCAAQLLSQRTKYPSGCEGYI